MILAVIYLLVAPILFFLIKDALLHSTVKLSQKEEKKELIKPNPVDVSLIVTDLKSKKEFTYTMQDDQTINDLLNKVREDKKILFEISRYTDHIEIIEVGGNSNPTGYKWALFEGATDSTNEIDKELLKSNGVYEIKLIQI